MRLILLSSFLFFVSVSSFGQGSPCQEAASTAHFSFNQCMASQSYEEFTAVITDEQNCSPLSIVGDHLYRDNPMFNSHSCTPGVSSLGMCVSIDEGCVYDALSDKSINIDVQITPEAGSSAILSGLSFYEQSSPFYLWQFGQTGDNDYPTFYSVVVKVNGGVIYSETNIPTNQTWTQQSFDFSNNPNFNVDSPTVFNIELLAYCPVGNGAGVSVWDIDELNIEASCAALPEGGTLTGGPFEFCVGDDTSDLIDSSEIVLTGNSGASSQWIVTDANANILGLPDHFTAVDFDGVPPGTCLIWHLSYEGTIEGLSVGNDATELEGCFALSNAIEVNRINLSGGTLLGGPFVFCVGDSIPDVVGADQIILTGNTGANSQWVITDDQGNILGLPSSFADVDFDGAGLGTCLIWHLSFADGLQGAAVGNNAANLVGCFDLSNPIEVQRSGPQGGVLEGGPFTFCVGDGFADFINPGDIILTGNTGTNSQWVVTDDQGNILGLPPMLSAVNFDEAGIGTCLVWHLSFEDELMGAIVGNNASDLEGCFDLSNPIEVNRSTTEAAVLEGGPFVFCVGDGEGDFIDSSAITVNGGVGSNTQWVVTDQQGNILGLPSSYSDVDFDTAGEGICLVWLLHYEGVLSGAVVGNNASLLGGCFSLSNAIPVIRNQTVGGELEGGPFEFCVRDGEADFIDSTAITLSGNIGSNSQWVITDAQGIIIGLPDYFTDVNFDLANGGTCLIWHLSFENGLQGAQVGNNASDLEGCFSLSNPLEVLRTETTGGQLEGGPFTFCVGDGEADFIGVNEIALMGNVGTNTQWVITDQSGMILGLPSSFSDVDFETAGAGTCLVWHLSFEDGLMGAAVGNNASDLEGCFSLSNPIEVLRTDDPAVCGNVICPEEEEMTLFGLVDGNLITLSQTTGALLQIIPLITDLDDFGSFTWHETEDVFYAIAGRVSGPRLVKIDRYTGLVTEVGMLFPSVSTIPDFTICEALEYNSDNGKIYASAGNNPSNNNFFSRTLFEVNTSSGACDLVGNISGSCQNEADFMAFANGVMYYTDGCPMPLNFGSINLNNGNQVFIRNVVEVESGRLDGHPDTGQLWMFDALSSELYMLDNNGQVDFVGLSYPVNLFDALIRDLEFAPFVSNGVYGGILDGGPFTFCIDDGEDDFLDTNDISLSGNNAFFNQWVITDSQGNILGITDDYTDVNFEGVEAGTCLIWHVSYDGMVENLEIGQNAFELEGCFGLSNPIQVIRESGADCGNVVAEEPLSSFTIYPNPASHSITIQNDFTDTQLIKIEIYNLEGRLVKSIDDYNMIDRAPINISDLASGIYSVHLVTGGRLVNHKRIVITN